MDVCHLRTVFVAFVNFVNRINQRPRSWNSIFSDDTNNELRGDRIGISDSFMEKKEASVISLPRPWIIALCNNSSPLTDQHDINIRPWRSFIKCLVVLLRRPPGCATLPPPASRLWVWGARWSFSQGLYFIDCEFSEGLTCTNPKTETKTETETQPLVMNIDTLLTEASEPGDKVMDPVQGDNGRRNCLE